MSSRGKRQRRTAHKRGNEGWRCHYCHHTFGNKQRKRGKFTTLDHIIPRKLGGPDTAWNRILCCRPCNHAKGGQTYEQFTGKTELPPQCHEWCRTTDEFLARFAPVFGQSTPMRYHRFSTAEGQP